MGLRYSVPLLRGSYVSLEPLAISHVAALVDAADEDRSTYRYTFVPRNIASMTSYVDALLAESQVGGVIPFALVDAQSARPVGATRYMTFRSREDCDSPYAVEIGGTWLAASAQESGVNTEAKLLLMGHAFDTWGVARVDFKSDARNERSRTAISRIGATFEGVLRHWQPSMVEGEETLYRDTAMYSVLDTEWPAVRANLLARLR